jgi:hypothetical protein
VIQKGGWESCQRERMGCLHKGREGADRETCWLSWRKIVVDRDDTIYHANTTSGGRRWRWQPRIRKPGLGGCRRHHLHRRQIPFFSLQLSQCLSKVRSPTHVASCIPFGIDGHVAHWPALVRRLVRLDRSDCSPARPFSPRLTGETSLFLELSADEPG